MSYSLSLTYRNIIGRLKVSDIKDMKLDTMDSLFDHTKIQYFTVPLPPKDTPLNIICRDNVTYNLLFLQRLHPRYI